MKNKIKKEMPREKLADYLEQLATALRKGSFETGDHRWLIPQKLQAKISHKEKRGRIDTNAIDKSILHRFMLMIPMNPSPQAEWHFWFGQCRPNKRSVGVSVADFKNQKCHPFKNEDFHQF